jgi:arginine deiminase
MTATTVLTAEDKVQAALEHLDTAIDMAHNTVAHSRELLGAARTYDQRKGSEYALAVAERRLADLKAVRKVLMTGKA